MISPAGYSGANSLFSAPLEGMRRGVAQAGAAAASIADGEIGPENVVAQIQAEVLVKANATMMRTADEILGAILDVTA